MYYIMSSYMEIEDTKGQPVPVPLYYEIEIEKSVSNLTDRAFVKCAMFHYNKHIKFGGNDSFDDNGSEVKEIYKLYKRGQKIEIFLGYNNKFELEFSGYISKVTTDDDKGMMIECEDGLFLFRKNIPNKVFNKTDVKQLAQYLINNVDRSFKLDCTFNIAYDRFTIYQADGADVLKKIQEDTGANIFFDMKTKTLHIHGKYMYKGGEAFFSMQHNIERSSLELRGTEDRKFEVKIEGTDMSGKIVSYTTGTTGGELITKKVGRITKSSIKIIAETELENLTRPGYSGSFDTWLIPYVEPGFTISIDDEDFPEKDDLYFCESVTTTFSENGGKRSITPSIKLSNNLKQRQNEILQNFFIGDQPE